MGIININPRKPTPAQLNYLDILFSDLGYTRTQRNAWLSDKYKRKISFTDQLTFDEVRDLISELKRDKEDKRNHSGPDIDYSIDELDEDEDDFNPLEF